MRITLVVELLLLGLLSTAVASATDSYCSNQCCHTRGCSGQDPVESQCLNHCLRSRRSQTFDESCTNSCCPEGCNTSNVRDFLCLKLCEDTREKRLSTKAPPTAASIDCSKCYPEQGCNMNNLAQAICVYTCRELKRKEAQSFPPSVPITERDCSKCCPNGICNPKNLVESMCKQSCEENVNRTSSSSTQKSLLRHKECWKCCPHGCTAGNIVEQMCMITCLRE